MATRTGTAHVVTTTRRYKNKVYRTHLLRRSYRQDGKGKNGTLGNLSHLPESVIDLIRRSLHGETFVPVGEALQICASRACGHVQAVALAIQRLGLPSLLASKPCPERDLVLAMVAQRIVSAATKLATTRLWHTTTLGADFGVAQASEDDLYRAMDWLLERQDRIQKKLASRHLKDDGLVLYDLSSSYFEGVCSRWPSAATAGTANAAACRSITVCSPMRGAGRWRSRCMREIPRTARRACPSSSACARSLALRTWCWWGIGA